MSSGFYSLKAELPDGKIYDFADLKGKTVLIVNVASKCGFTPHYKGLQSLYEKYKDRGLVVLGFPCNQFGSQEPGTAQDIQDFCSLNYGVTFPLMKKSDVNGDNTNEVYKWLKNEKAGLLGLTRVKASSPNSVALLIDGADVYRSSSQWNFEKFAIDKNGKVAYRWASTTSPGAIEAEIEKLL
ncbi:Glutathione peroxidase 2 [Leucoagaricus sp. SymC.cos]|nr:Glutathione peroxidase 2 [Leucoagaricus sp. SymC.cos]